MIEDITLLRAYVDRHSQAAFTALVQRRVGLVYSVALRRVGGDKQLAEDVAQKVFIELGRHAPTLLHRATIAGWLYRVAHGTAVDLVRQEHRRRVREPLGPLMQDASDNPLAAADWDRLRPTLDEAMSGLSESDRDAVALRFFEGRSFADTGRALQLSEDSARKRVERALEKVAAALARRGITSTTAAVSLVLAEPTAFAAPSGLAAAVAETALSGAGLKSSWTSINLTTPAKLKLSFALAGAVAAGLAFHEASSTREQVTQLTTLRQQHEELANHYAVTRQKLAAAEQRAQAAEDDSARLLAAIDRLQPSQSLTKSGPTRATATEPLSEQSQLRLRLIQLKREPGGTDSTLSHQATAILARFTSGENFANLAAEFSSDARRAKGGDWGWIKPSDLKAAVRDQAFSLKKGEASAPLILPEGCFILYAEDRR